MNDLLIANPVWNEKRLMNLAQKVKMGAQIVVMMDSFAHIEKWKRFQRNWMADF